VHIETPDCIGHRCYMIDVTSIIWIVSFVLAVSVLLKWHFVHLSKNVLQNLNREST
jgi:hypothetical protein